MASHHAPRHAYAEVAIDYRERETLATSYYMGVAVAGAVPVGTTIPITVTVRDNYGNTFVATYASIATVGG